MNNEHRENEIDEIFRQAIEPVNTEPSDKFWHKVAENIMVRESKLNQKRASRWRAVAFIFGAGLLLLGFFVYRMESVLNMQQVRKVSNSNNPLNIEKENSTGSPTNIDTKTKSDRSIANANIKNIEKQTAGSIRKNEVKHREYSGIKRSSNKTNTLAEADTKPIDREIDDKESAAPIAAVINKQLISDNKPSVSKGQVTIAADLNQIKAPESIQKPGDKNIPTHPPQIQTVIKTSPLTMACLKDTSKVIQKQGLKSDSNFSHFSLSAFFAPDFMIGYSYKCNNSDGDQVENSIKTGEKENFSYTAGAKLNYEFSPRFSISLGVAYQAFSFNISPGVIYAQKQQDGSVGYYVTTSSGMVECPYYYGTPAVGDSLKISASSTRTYLQIPLQLKYCFINKTSYKVYFSPGIETNICIGEMTTMNWQDFWYDKGVAVVTSTEGEEKAYYSYSLGIGADFKVAKNVSIYIEPELHEALTSLDNNVSVITYPRLFSANAGVTYHLR